VVLISPTLSNYLPLLQRTFPGAKHVLYQRDALDTIASMKGFLARNQDGIISRYKRYTYAGRLGACKAVAIHLFHRLRWTRCKSRGYLGARPAGFQKAAGLPLVEFLSWYYTANQRSIQQAMSTLPEDRTLTVHYEDIVTNYRDEIARLLQFIGVDAMPREVPEPRDGVKTSAIGRHKAVFDVAEIRAIRNYLASQQSLDMKLPLP